LLKQGRMTRLPNGLLDPATADLERTRTTRLRVRPERPERSKETDAYNVARAVHEVYQAQIGKFEYERTRENLVHLDRVCRSAARAFDNVRAHFAGLARVLAAPIAATSNPAAVERMLADAIDRTLERLATDVFSEPV
jgi:hypothetical protein